MKYLRNRIKQQTQKGIQPDLFKNEDGAIDLASIMVGIIVIGLIGGVIAATVFAVIPWSQDNAAKQQLDSVVSAESAYFGLSADNPPALPAGSKANSFAKSAELAAANLLQAGPRYCVTTPTDSKSYDAYSQSSSGKVFTVTDKNTKPVIFTGTLPTDCQFITEGAAASPAPTTPAPYVDPTPTLTVMTFKCDTAVSNGAAPLYSSITGTETWSVGGTSSGTYTYNNISTMKARGFAAGVTYTMTFDGTYDRVLYNASQPVIDLLPCLRSIDHWGSDIKVTDVRMAFYNAKNLTNVPANIPPTITNMSNMFTGVTKLNDPNISQWDVSHVQNMYQMFSGATAFNQPLNNWNVSNVYNMSFAFSGATAFNQPLNNWNVSKVTNVYGMFNGDTLFNQDLSKWNTASVTSGAYFAPNTFNSAYLPPNTTKAP
jgi:surface protein